jgi:hypothetical protein
VAFGGPSCRAPLSLVREHERDKTHSPRTLHGLWEARCLWPRTLSLASLSPSRPNPNAINTGPPISSAPSSGGISGCGGARRARLPRVAPARAATGELVDCEYLGVKGTLGCKGMYLGAEDT